MDKNIIRIMKIKLYHWTEYKKEYETTNHWTGCDKRLVNIEKRMFI